MATPASQVKSSLPAVPDEEVSQAEFARRMNCSRQNINKLVRKGTLTLNANGKLLFIAAVADYASNTDEGHHERLQRDDVDGNQAEGGEAAAGQADVVSQETTSEIPDTYKQARTERERSAADLAAIKLAEKTGRLIDADQVKKDAFQMARALRDAILAVPDRVAPILAAEQSERRVAVILAEELEKALNGLAIISEK